MAAQPVEPPEESQEGVEESEKPVKKTAAKKTAKKTAAKRPSAPRRGKNRRSGQPAASEEAVKQTEEMDQPVRDAELPDEREEWFRAPGFQRMRTAWEGDDATQMRTVQTLIDKKVWETFPEALALMNDIYNVVREPEVDQQTGEIRTDLYGQAVWRKDPFTMVFVEDWSLLTHSQRDHFLMRITTNLFEWEQRAADLWTRAMFSKGMFTERFAIEYDAGIHGTIDDRNARGNVEAAEDRYFALMNAAISRKADALVRTLTNLMLRLKDTLS